MFIQGRAGRARRGWRRVGGGGSSRGRPHFLSDVLLIEQLFRVLQLLLPQRRVEAARLQQLLVRAVLVHLTLLQHQDGVAALHRRQPVRDDQRRQCTRRRALPQRRHRTRLRPRVQSRRGLVGKQDRRAAQQGAGDRHALLLAARQLHAHLAHTRLVLLREAQHSFVQPRLAHRVLHLLVRGVEAPVANVVHKRVVEQHRVLRDHAHVPAQTRALHSVHVLPVHEHLPRLRRVELEQQLHERRLAAARRAHHAERRAGGDLEAHALQHLLVVLVVEAHVAELDVTALVLERHHRRVRVVAAVRLLVRLERQQLEQLLHVRQRRAQLAVHGAQEVEGDRELHQQRVHEDKVAQRHRARRHARHAHRHRDTEGRREDELLSEVQEAQALRGQHRLLRVVAHVLVVATQLVRLVLEVLHRLVVQQPVDQTRRRLVVRLVHLLPHADAPGGQLEGEHRVGTHGTQRRRRKGKTRLHVQHPRHQHQLQGRRHNVEQREVQEAVDGLGAALDGAGDGAGLPVDVVGEGEVVEVCDDAAAELPHRVLHDGRKEDSARLLRQELQRAEQRVRQHQAEDAEAHRVERLRHDERVARQRVDDALEPVRHADAEQLRREHAAHRDADLRAQAALALLLRPDLPRDAAQHRDRAALLSVSLRVVVPDRRAARLRRRRRRRLLLRAQPPLLLQPQLP
eukprot:Rhum_TRINITY_DN15076_c14_g1::Rhum_TRINITY_DN15076_c14_g1_i1::g.136803::m.136803